MTEVGKVKCDLYGTCVFVLINSEIVLIFHYLKLFCTIGATCIFLSVTSTVFDICIYFFFL